MTKIEELRERRATLIADARALHDAAPDGVMSAEDQEKFDRTMNDADALGETIAREERLSELEREERTELPPSQRSDDDDRGGGRSEARVEAYRAALSRYLRLGLGRLTHEERETLESGLVDVEQRGMSELTGAAGAYIVAPDTRFYSSIIDARKFFGGMRRAGATVVPTATAGDMPIPTDDDTGNVGEIIVEEGSHDGGANVTIRQKILRAYTYSSKIVKVSRQLLRDAAFPLESWLGGKLGMRIERIANQHFTTGLGVNQPKGITVGITAGKVGASGQTTSVTADDLFDLQHAVDVAYRSMPSTGWMFHDQTLRDIRKLKDGSGQYLLQVGLRQGEPDTLLGHPFTVNNDMPVMAASAHAILFGAFENYFIRDVEGIAVVRLDERFADTAQVGFVALAEMDGGLIDAGQNPVKSYQNAAS